MFIAFLSISSSHILRSQDVFIAFPLLTTFHSASGIPFFHYSILRVFCVSPFFAFFTFYFISGVNDITPFYLAEHIRKKKGVSETKKNLIRKNLFRILKPLMRFQRSTTHFNFFFFLMESFLEFFHKDWIICLKIFLTRNIKSYLCKLIRMLVLKSSCKI